MAGARGRWLSQWHDIPEHDEHTSYRTSRNAGAALACATEYIDQFLIALEPPPPGTVCGEDPEA